MSGVVLIIVHHNFSTINCISQVDNDYFVSGIFQDSLFIADDTLQSPGKTDVYLARLNSAGAFTGLRVISGLDNDYSASMMGNGTDIFQFGYFYSYDLKLDSIDNIKSSKILSSKGSRDMFLAKYSGSDFKLQWVKQIGGISDDVARGIFISNDKIYLTGYFSNQVVFGADTLYSSGTLNNDPFVCTVNGEGVILNAASMKGVGNYEDGGYAIVVDEDEDIYVSGSFKSPKLYTKTDTLLNSHQTFFNLFLAKYGCLPITYNPAITANLNCFDDSSGIIELSGSGGFTGLMFSIDGGQSYEGINIFDQLDAGDYTILVKDSTGCTVPGEMVTLTEPSELLIQNVAYTDVTAYQAEDGTITVTADGGILPYSFTLNEGAAQETGAFNGLMVGDYTVSLTDAHNCGPLETDTITITGPNSIEGLFEGRLKIYPNPATNNLRIEMTGITTNSLHISLFDASGRQLLNREVEIVNGFLNADLDISQLQSGLMFLKIGNEKKLVPVVKSR